MPVSTASSSWPRWPTDHRPTTICQTISPIPAESFPWGFFCFFKLFRSHRPHVGIGRRKPVAAVLFFQSHLCFYGKHLFTLTRYCFFYLFNMTFRDFMYICPHAEAEHPVDFGHSINALRACRRFRLSIPLGRGGVGRPLPCACCSRRTSLFIISRSF